MKPQVGVILYIDGTPLGACGTFRGVWAFRNPAAGQGAAEFMTLVFVAAPAAHPEACLAEGMPILVQGDVLRDALHGSPSLIEVDQCVDVPAFKQTVGRKIVVGGIQAEVRGRDAESMRTKSVYGIQKVNAVMTLGTGKVHQDGELCF